MNIQELKQARQIIQDNYNLSPADCARVVGYINTHNSHIINNILSGDLSGVPSVLSALDIQAAGSAEKTVKKSGCDPVKKSVKDIKTPSSLHSDVIQPAGMMGDNFTDNDIKADSSPNDVIIQPENTSQEHDNNIHDDILPESGLPVGLYEDINGWIFDYCRLHNIDKNKIDARQWRSVCSYVGEHIKQTKILHDVQREKTEGGIRYNPALMVALLDMFDIICSDYKQTAFKFLFHRFAGVSRQYFNDYFEQGLTSSCVQLKQKAEQIQNESIVSSISSGGSQTVANIFLGKSLAHMVEAAPASSAPVAVVISLDDVPKLAKNVDK